MKLESLERRLKANEKARKEIEAEAEKWKERAVKNSKRLPDLELELAEITQAKEEWKAKSQEVEVENRQLVQELKEVQKKLEEAENSMKEFHRKMVPIFNLNSNQNTEDDDPEDGLPLVDLGELEQEIMKYQSKCLLLEQENSGLKEQLQQLSSTLSLNQNHVSTLMNHLETNKEHNREINGICRRVMIIESLSINH